MQKLFHFNTWPFWQKLCPFPCLCISGAAEIMKPYSCGRQHLHISYLKSAVPFSSLYFRVTEGHFVLSPASHTIELSSFFLFMTRTQVAPPFPQRSCHTLPRADGYFRALGPFIVTSHKQQHTHAQKTHTRKHRANDLCCISSLPSHKTGIEVKLSTQRALWEHDDSVDERDFFHCGSIGGQKSQSTALLSL